MTNQESPSQETEKPDRFAPAKGTPIKRSVRNAAIITVVVGAVNQFQGEEFLSTILTMTFTFAVITPALWLSYRMTEKWLNRS